MATARITARNKPQIYGKYFKEIKAWHIEGGSMSPRNQTDRIASVKLNQLKFAVRKIYLTLN